MKNKKSTKKKNSVYMIIVCLILCVYSLSMLFPIAWGIMNSFKHIIEFGTNPNGLPDPSLFSKYPVSDDYTNIFGNYITMFKNIEYKRIISYYRGIFTEELVRKRVAYSGSTTLLLFFMNSLLIGFAYSVIPALMGCLTGYVCSNYKFKFSGIVYTVVLFVMATPILGNTAANINLLRKIGFYDNYLGLIISCCGFYNMYFLMFYAFFNGLTSSYFEAAEIDGASQVGLMTKIAIPMAKPLIFSTIMVLFMNSWNNYNVSLLTMPSYPTLAYGVFINIVENTKFARVPYQLAALMLLALPSLTLFIYLKSKLLGNISLGGVKE